MERISIKHRVRQCDRRCVVETWFSFPPEESTDPRSPPPLATDLFDGRALGSQPVLDQSRLCYLEAQLPVMPAQSIPLVSRQVQMKMNLLGIVPIFEVGAYKGKHFFSMACIEGCRLAARLNGGPIDPRQAARILHQVAQAVQYAHDQGVIHRDLKPGNILLDQAGQPKVTDFGLAKKMSTESNLTGTGQILGTPTYMAPEQASGKTTDVGPLADVYSLRAVLYCLLTGRPPFQAATTMDTLLQVMEKQPVAPRRLNTSVPLDLDTIVHKCLEKVPSKRYLSAQELVDELGRFLDGRPIIARPISSAERGRRWCRRNPVVSGLAGILLLIGAGIQSWASAERWKNQKEQTRVAAESLQNNLGPSIPVNIKELRKLPKELALGELTMRFESATNPRHKLALAFALANYGRVETEYLVSRIDDIAETDTGNFLAALKFDRNKATATLKNEAAKCSDKALWRRKAKLATASLAFSSTEIAHDVCTYENRPDPEQRTFFIDEFPRWELGLGELASTVRVTDSSALHSAASWLLRQWKFNLPEISKQNEIMLQRDWFVNSVGSTMLRIPRVPPDVYLPDPIEKYRQQLKHLENAAALEMEKRKTRVTRAIAYFHTEKTEEALHRDPRFVAMLKK